MLPVTVAIVCAKDEGTRIGRVLDVLTPMLPTIVVDDGSSDNTFYIAKQKGAKVLRLSRNVGKGQAMRYGVEAVPNADIILFIDADLNGLRRDHVASLIMPVVRGSFGMVVGMRDHGRNMAPVQRDAYNKLVSRLPLISGERAIRRDILSSMPEYAWNEYGVETWINHTAARSGYPIGTVTLDGLSETKKWDKFQSKAGQLNPGFANMVRMGEQVVNAHVQAARPAFSQSHVDFAPMPITIRPDVNTSDDVMRELSRTFARESAPYVKEHLWTRAQQENVGDAIGRRMAAPLWAIACCGVGIVFGPMAGFMTAITGMGYDMYQDYLRSR